MKTFGQEVKTKPSFSTNKINKLRLDLIKEELSELIETMNNNDLLEVADALTDILYVTYGAGHAFGINLDRCFEEVQNSNMSKLDENGKPIYNESGKVMKGPNYFKPDLSKFVN
jgi:predicted HAD superfamily Cof-like phosphohydrolase